MALSSSDDNPFNNIAPILHSKEYHLDALMNYNSKFSISSIFTLIPLFLVKIHLSIFFIWSMMVLAQTTLMFLAIKALSKSLIDSQIFILMNWTFLLLCKPYYLNLAGVSELDYQPYAFWIALSLGIFSLTNLIERKLSKLSAYCVLCYLFHPATGILLAIFLVIFIFLHERLAFKKLCRNLVVIPLHAFCVVVYNFHDNVKSPNYIMKILQENTHLNYWNPSSSSFGAFTIFLWLLVFSLGISVNYYAVDQKLKEAKQVFNLLGVFGIGAILIQALSTKINFLLVMSLVPARISVFYVLLGFAVVLAQIQLDIRERKLGSIFNLILVIYPSPYLLLSLAAGNHKDLKLRKVANYLRIVIIICGLVTISGYTIIHIYPFAPFWSKYYLDLTQFDLATPLRSSLVLYPVALLVFILIVYSLVRLICIQKMKWDIQQFFSISAGVLASLVIISLGLQSQYQYSFQNNQFPVEKVKDLAQAQLWASTNTPNNSNFIVTPVRAFTPWRTLSQRPVVTPGYVAGLYGINKETNAFNLKVTKFWQSHSGDFTSDENLCAFIHIFGGDYLVEDKSKPYSLLSSRKLVFSNNSYNIYNLNCEN